MIAFGLVQYFQKRGLGPAVWRACDPNGRALFLECRVRGLFGALRAGGTGVHHA